MRDLHNNVSVQQTVDPQTVVATPVNGDPVDGQGFNSVEHIVFVGDAGDAWSGSLGYTLVLQDGDQSDLSDAADVTDVSYVLGPSAITNGVFATLSDGANHDLQAYKIGYVGPKRYTRVRVEIVGSPATGTPMSAAALKGNAADSPVS